MHLLPSGDDTNPLTPTKRIAAVGQAFTLVPDERTNGWTGKLRASGGATGFMIGGELSAEKQQNHAALALRVNLTIGL
jgi:hypothetical protein